MDPVGLKENYLSSDLIDWYYRITDKELFQIAESTSLEVFQQE